MKKKQANASQSGNEDNGEVGYGKPPKHSQFQKGQSGNPNGRPKTDKKWNELLEDELQQIIQVNGKNMTVKSMLAKSLIRNAANGKPAAMDIIFTHIAQQGEASEAENFDPKSEDHAILLQWNAKMKSTL